MIRAAAFLASAAATLPAAAGDAVVWETSAFVATSTAPGPAVFADGWLVVASAADLPEGDPRPNLHVLDVRDPARPRLAGALRLPGEPEDLAVSGGFAFVVSGGSGLLVGDLTDPAWPALAAAPFYPRRGQAFTFHPSLIVEDGMA